MCRVGTKLFVREPVQALFFSLFMPMLILFIFGSMDFDKPTSIRVGLAVHHPSAATEHVSSAHLQMGSRRLPISEEHAGKMSWRI